MEHFKNKNEIPFNSENGFVLISVLVLLPVILAGLTFLFIGTTQIEMRSHLNQTCRSELMSIQEKAPPLIRAILALNTLVDLVRWTDRILIAASMASILFLPSIIVIKELYSANQTAKKGIRILQKVILGSLWTLLELGLFNTQRKISNLLDQYKTRIQKLSSITQKLVYGNYFRTLSLEPEDTSYDPPKYKLKENFEEAQKLFIHWRYRLEAQPPLSRWVKWGQSFSGHCAATLKKENPWSPTLYADKFYWKQL